MHTALFPPYTIRSNIPTNVINLRDIPTYRQLYTNDQAEIELLEKDIFFNNIIDVETYNYLKDILSNAPYKTTTSFRCFKNITDHEVVNMLTAFSDHVIKFKQLVAKYLAEDKKDDYNRNLTRIADFIKKFKKKISNSEKSYLIFIEYQEDIEKLCLIMEALERTPNEIIKNELKICINNSADIINSKQLNLKDEPHSIATIFSTLIDRLPCKWKMIAKKKEDLITAIIVSRLKKDEEQGLLFLDKKEKITIITAIKNRVADFFGIKTNNISKDAITVDTLELTNFIKLMISPNFITEQVSLDLRNNFCALISDSLNFNIFETIVINCSNNAKIKMFDSSIVSFVDKCNKLCEVTEEDYQLTPDMINLVINKEYEQKTNCYLYNIDVCNLDHLLTVWLAHSMLQIEPKIIANIISNQTICDTQTTEDLAIVGIGSSCFFVVDKNKQPNNSEVKLDFNNIIVLELNHISKAIFELPPQMCLPIIKQSLQQTQNSKVIVKFLTNEEVKNYFTQSSEYLDFLSENISIMINTDKDFITELALEIFNNSQYIKSNNKLSLKYSYWYRATSIQEQLLKKCVTARVDISDCVYQLQIEDLLFFDDPESLKKFLYSILQTKPTSYSCIINNLKKQLNVDFDKLKYCQKSNVFSNLVATGFLKKDIKCNELSERLLKAIKKQNAQQINSITAEVNAAHGKYYPNMKIIHDNDLKPLFDACKNDNLAIIEAFTKLEKAIPPHNYNYFNEKKKTDNTSHDFSTRSCIDVLLHTNNKKLLKKVFQLWNTFMKGRSLNENLYIGLKNAILLYSTEDYLDYGKLSMLYKLSGLFGCEFEAYINSEFPVNGNRTSLLHYGVANNNPYLTIFLLALEETDVNKVFIWSTPLFIAANHGYSGIFSLLLKHENIDPNVLMIRRNGNQYNILFLLCANSTTLFPDDNDTMIDSMYKMIEMLAKHPKANHNLLLSTAHVYPLWQAVFENNCRLLKVLFELFPSIDPNFIFCNQTPLEYAINKEYHDIVKLLRDNGAVG